MEGAARDQPAVPDGSEELTLLTIDEVAARLRVPVLTIRWLRQEGRFAPAIKIGRRLVWSEAAIREWILSQSEARMAG